MARSASVLQILHVFFGQLTRNNVCLERVHGEAKCPEDSVSEDVAYPGTLSNSALRHYWRMHKAFKSLAREKKNSAAY